MGFFDSSIAQSVQSVVQKAQSVDNFIANNTPASLIKEGVAQAGNLTPAQIASGLTGAPAQPSVVPSSVPADEISNASPIPGQIIGAVTGGAGKGVMLLAALAAGYYFFFRKK